MLPLLSVPPPLPLFIRISAVLSCLQEAVAGVIVLVSKEALQHHGIFLSMEGLVNLQLSSKSVGVFEAFYNSVKVDDV